MAVRDWERVHSPETCPSRRREGSGAGGELSKCLHLPLVCHIWRVTDSPVVAE